MICAPMPEDEAFRLGTLRASGLLDSPPDTQLDTLVHVVARAFHVPMAVISLVDQHRQWFIARSGLAAAETPLDCAFCAHVLWSPASMVVLDTHKDARFADNPLVAGDPKIRFYAGYPVRLRGACIGTLCLLDHRPHHEFQRAEERILQGAAFAAEERLVQLSEAAWTAGGRQSHHQVLSLSA